MITESSSPKFDILLHTTFQQLRAASTEGVVVAMTSANSGEGVTHSVTALLNSLSKDRVRRIIQVNACELSNVSCAPASLFRYFKPVGNNIYKFMPVARPTATLNPNHSWTENWQYRRDCIQQLRSSFDYILIDCPAIKRTGDALSLAPLVDGMVMVIESGRTRVDQIIHAEKCIEFARGHLIGHILNKRSLDIPNWLCKGPKA